MSGGGGAEGELSGVQQSEDGGAEGVGEDLDVSAGAFAAGLTCCGEGEVGLLGVVDLCCYLLEIFFYFFRFLWGRRWGGGRSWFGGERERIRSCQNVDIGEKRRAKVN